jgi:hypothetical protein
LAIAATPHAFVQQPADFGFLLRRQRPAPAELLSLRFGSLQTGLCAFDQQIAFELRHRTQHSHCEFARGAVQIDAAQRQAMHPHADLRQARDGRDDVDGVSAEPIQLVTTSTSSSSIFSSRRVKPGRRLIATLPEIVSTTTRRCSIRNPAFSISSSWFSTVKSSLETLA